MPIRFKNPEDIQEIISNTYGCLICHTPISYESTKSKFCLNCSLKYSVQIQEAEKSGRCIIDIITEHYNGSDKNGK